VSRDTSGATRVKKGVWERWMSHKLMSCLCDVTAHQHIVMRLRCHIDNDQNRWAAHRVVVAEWAPLVHLVVKP